MVADASELVALAAALAAAGPKAKAYASAATRRAAADVSGRAKMLAPVDTGFLRSSISVTMNAPTDALIGPTANYGRYVEEGTSRMVAQPYMGPALDQVEPRFEAELAAVAGVIL